MRIDGHEIHLSREDKQLFPDGTTKGELIAYYREVAPTMLPHLRRRPLTMHRFPDGVAGESFYQQDMPDYFPGWIHHVMVKKEGGKVTHVVCDDAATLVYLANQACITPHMWLSRRDRLHHPDRLVFDFDPSAEDFAPVREGARRLKDLLTAAGLTPFVMTTGSRGLHVVAPLDGEADFDTVRQFATRVADILSEQNSEAFTTERLKAKRGGRVFIDVARNAYAQTAVAPYAVRARSVPYVATPLEWDEIGDADLTPTKYSIQNIFRRLGQKGDPWRDIDAELGSIKPASEYLTS